MSSECREGPLFVSNATCRPGAGGAYWLMKTLDEHRKLLDCVASGRRNCLEQIEPAAGPPPGG